jgi:hypothetical protein
MQGLTENDVVVVAPESNLRDGTRVQIDAQ